MPSQGAVQIDKKEGEIWGKIDRISSLLDTLDGKSGNLANRLVPVVAQIPEASADSEKSTPTLSQIGETLEIFAGRIKGVNDRLEYILKNLQM